MNPQLPDDTRYREYPPDARQTLGAIATLLDRPEPAVVASALPLLRDLVADGLLV